MNFVAKNLAVPIFCCNFACELGLECLYFFFALQRYKKTFNNPNFFVCIFQKND